MSAVAKLREYWEHESPKYPRGSVVWLEEGRGTVLRAYGYHDMRTGRTASELYDVWLDSGPVLEGLLRHSLRWQNSWGLEP